MAKLTVKVPESKSWEYEIEIGNNILNSVCQKIESRFGLSQKFIVTDENVLKAGHLFEFLGNHSIPHYVIKPGESSKNIETFTGILDQMERSYLGRDTIVIALGGGVVGDIAGFAAAVFKRGVIVIQIPTTTIAQADSAIGGKTGVDSSFSKNAYGCFWHPSAVFIDVAVLKTLDQRQYRAGLVESVKHALIADEKYFEFLENNLESILNRKTDILEKIAYYNCQIKAEIVEADPLEKNQRRVLNYGHTIGHAVEKASGFELLHGEAVAIGIIAAEMIEIELGLGDEKRLKRIKNILINLKLPTAISPKIDKKELIDLLKHDKKAINKWPKFVLIDKIGNVHRREGQWAVEVKQELIEKILGKL